MKKTVPCPYGCGKLFANAESIEKWHGWCAKKRGVVTTGRVIETRSYPALDIKRQDPMVALFERAEAAGDAAANNLRPVGMVVQQHASPLDDSSPVVEQWHVPEGVCGFSTVQLKPGTHRLCKAAIERYGGKEGAHTEGWRTLPGRPLARKDSYLGGVGVSIMGYNQSMQRKEAYAHAWLDVITEAYPELREKSWVNTRMD